MPPASPTPTITSQAGQTCFYQGVLPDPSCTPGAVDPAVTQANIGSTICVSGYTTTVRPPTSYTNPLKVQQMAAYGDADRLPSDVEEDHLIPLELGGAPRDTKNLWPEPWSGDENAGSKDQVENALHRAVCAGDVTLQVAQRAIAEDWTTAEAVAGLASSPPSSAPSQPSPSLPPAATPTTPPQPGGVYRSGDAYNCSDFSTYAAAKAYFDAVPGDPSKLDADHDGIPCESLPGAP